MTLPPFPFLPASPEERLRLTQYGELCVMAGKRDAERMRAEFFAWVQDQGCDTDGAWSAWQAAWELRGAARTGFDVDAFPSLALDEIDAARSGGKGDGE